MREETIDVPLQFRGSDRGWPGGAETIRPKAVSFLGLGRNESHRNEPVANPRHLIGDRNTSPGIDLRILTAKRG